MKRNIAILILLATAANPAFAWRRIHKPSKKIVRIVAAEVAIGVVSGIVAKHEANRRTVPSVTIFGPGTPSVGKP